MNRLSCQDESLGDKKASAKLQGSGYGGWETAAGTSRAPRDPLEMSWSARSADRRVCGVRLFVDKGDSMLRCGTCQGRDADHRSGGPRLLVAEKPANILSPREPLIQRVESAPERR